MKNNIKKIFYNLMVLFMSVPQMLFAAPATSGPSDELFINPIGKATSISALVAAILDVVTKIGAVVVIFAIIYSGFLFVKAQGNDSEIETAKKTFFWAIIGGVILLGAKTLAIVLCNTANDLGAGASCIF